MDEIVAEDFVPEHPHEIDASNWAKPITKWISVRCGKPGPIPKGLNQSARGCEARATPGTRNEIHTTLKGLNGVAGLGAGDFPSIKTNRDPASEKFLRHAQPRNRDSRSINRSQQWRNLHLHLRHLRA